MAGYEIGISGLNAAQKALNVIGNNLANAATEGFHRQDIDLRPAPDSYTYGVMIGQGVNFAGIERQINEFLESELLAHNCSLSDVSRMLDSLQIIESAMGEMSSTGISSSLDQFYSSLYELSIHPRDVNYQTAVLASAETLTHQFRNLATVVSNLQESIYAEARTTVDKVNEMAVQIADLNKQIFTLQVRGEECSSLLDQRDQLIVELGELVGVRTQKREYGVVDVSVSEIPLVIGTFTSPIKMGMIPNGQFFDLGLAPSDSEAYETEITGGSLGGIFTLCNDTLRSFQTQLDTLAQTLITQTNRLHVQGIGSSGSFTSLTGWTMSESNLADIVPPIQNGTIYVRVIDPSGVETRHAVTVNTSDTLADIAADLALIPGLEDDTGVYSGRLQIVANTGYKFDFLPGVISTPTATVPNPLSGAGPAPEQASPEISISGLYTGNTNQTYTCTVVTSPPGSTLAVGNGTMSLEVTDGLGNTVATLQIGQDYEPGSSLLIEKGISVSLGISGTSPGYLNDGESFTIQALANSDTSGFLAAVGINCFFSGRDAASIDLSDLVSQSGGRIAVSLGSEGNENCLAMARLGEEAQADLGGLSIKDYYRQTAITIGHEMSMLQLRRDNTEGLIRNLQQRRDEISSVDVNEQASLMVIYERMFQAMAKYMNTVNESMNTVLTILS